jgi:hypothetical protein
MSLAITSQCVRKIRDDICVSTGDVACARNHASGMDASRSARIPKYVFPLALAGIVGIATPTSGCGGSGGNSGFGGGGGNGSGGNGGNGGSGGSFSSSSSGSGSGNGSGGTVACPSGLQCNVSCSSGTTTSISGVVFDPAGKDPLYNIAVYVPATPLKPLPSGVPTGPDACSCGALFPSGSVVQTATGVDGSFKLTNAPVGNVPLVIQVGKWRRLFQVNTTACQNTALPSGMLTLPSTVPAGDTNTSMPQIAVSTGGADTLECLMTRIGLPTSEYVSGAGGAGHVHLFAGGQQGGGGGGGHHGGGGGGGGGGQIGQPEQGTAGVFPESDTNLWDSQTHLMPYDILLLSCEGGETYNANPSVLQAYLNAGGRAFGSHYHYAWFSGPIDSGQSYSAPPGWGSALATWSGGGGNANGQANGKIVQTLNGSTQPFPKGVALYQWLGLNGALGALNAPMGELPMVPPRYNAVVGPNNTPSQPWVQDDTTANTMYFSFDTPIGGMPNPDGGAALYCGRAVFSDLHVGGETMPADSPPPPPAGPNGCTQAELSPQEKALEFMLFDLSSCVIPDSVQPQQPDGGGIVQ